MFSQRGCTTHVHAIHKKKHNAFGRDVKRNHSCRWVEVQLFSSACKLTHVTCARLIRARETKKWLVCNGVAKDKGIVLRFKAISFFVKDSFEERRTRQSQTKPGQFKIAVGNYVYKNRKLIFTMEKDLSLSTLHCLLCIVEKMEHVNQGPKPFFCFRLKER